MNEKIKELAEQAGSTHKQSLGVYQFYEHELEKFAELIVQVTQREWVGLTDEEVNALLGKMSLGANDEDVRLIEAKLKEKNT